MKKTVYHKQAHKGTIKMLRSTAAASVFVFDQTRSLSGFAWHAFLVLSNFRYLKISLALPRTPFITIHNGIQSQIHTHIVYIHATRRQHTEHHQRTAFVGPSGQCLRIRSNGTKQAHPSLIVCDVINT